MTVGVLECCSLLRVILDTGYWMLGSAGVVGCCGWNVGVLFFAESDTGCWAVPVLLAAAVGMLECWSAGVLFFAESDAGCWMLGRTGVTAMSVLVDAASVVSSLNRITQHPVSSIQHLYQHRPVLIRYDPASAPTGVTAMSVLVDAASVVSSLNRITQHPVSSIQHLYQHRPVLILGMISNQYRASSIPPSFLPQSGKFSPSPRAIFWTNHDFPTISRRPKKTSSRFSGLKRTS